MADLAIPGMTKYRYFFVHTKRWDIEFSGTQGDRFDLYLIYTYIRFGDNGVPV